MTDGEPDFHKIHDDFRPRIRRYLSRLVSEDEADDLTQEVFVKVSRGLPGYKGDSQLSTWIYRIATNAAMDRLRSPAYRKEAVSEEDPRESAVKHEGPPVDQQLVRDEMNRCIRDVVDTLPPAYKTVIVLSEIKELKNQEIAGILGVSVDAVKIRLHRARARLKKDLEGKCQFYRDERNEFACEPKTVPIKFKGRK